MVINTEDFKNNVRNERTKIFIKPYDFIYKEFEKLKFHTKNNQFFFDNASEIIDKLREMTWKDFQKQEEKFSSDMLLSLVEEEDLYGLSPFEAVTWFSQTFPTHIYQLNLSNTNSRRSRAGKEFEAIIELILIGAGIPVDSQGNIATSSFAEKGLGKLVDVVSPGAVEYLLNKRNTVLVSAKTTLRERWQEVPEEMQRTGAREMFLITLDETISENVINNLYESNIQIVTTYINKTTHYAEYSSVLDFESLLEILQDNAKRWETFEYDEESLEEKIKLTKIQLEHHKEHKFVVDYYAKALKKLKNLKDN